jgi:hypothetical protein
MKTLKITKASIPTQLTRVLTLSVLGIVSLFMFSLAYTASAATLYRQLELGMRGSDVSSLQTFLALDSTIYPQGLVTGYFGVLTKAAVSNFQVRNGILNVGRVGPITMAAINAQMNGGNTVGFDRYAPTISLLSVSTTQTAATINWNTSENSSAVVYFSTLPLSMIEASSNSAVTIGGSSLLVHADLRLSHSAAITGLQSNTTYYYVVYVKDGSGNESVTWPATFHTN